MDTIADGIAVPESVARPRELVDDVVLVGDDAIRDDADLALRTLGLVPEPAGAVGIAAPAVHDVPGGTVATVLTGSNVWDSPQPVRQD